MAELTPSEWFVKLDGFFTAITRPKWQDHRLRPSGGPDGPVAFAPCSREFTPRNQLYDTLWSYYVGDAPLPHLAAEYQDVFRDVLRKARSNHSQLIINAMLDRMELQAVSTQKDQDTNGDDLAAEIMEESGFGAKFKEALEFLFTMSESYLMAVPGPQGGVPTIHAIDPRRCVGIPDPVNPLRLRAALVKQFDHVTDEHVSHLYLPGERWEIRAKAGAVQWDLRALDDAPAEIIAGLEQFGGIPIVRLDNAHSLGEYEPHLDLMDRINDDNLQRIVGMWYQMLRQRALIGDEDDDESEDFTDDTDDESTGDFWKRAGEEIFKADPGSLWKVPDGYTFWESAQTDFGGALQAKRDDVKELAAVTSTPLHLITPDDANGSAEGAGLIRESSTAKVRDRRERISPSLKLLWRMAFAMAGETDRGRRIRLHWGPIEFRTLAEQASASAQAQGTLSLEDRCERIWQMSPDEIARNRQRLDAERLIAAASAPRPIQPPGQQVSGQEQPAIRPAAEQATA